MTDAVPRRSRFNEDSSMFAHSFGPGRGVSFRHMMLVLVTLSAAAMAAPGWVAAEVNSIDRIAIVTPASRTNQGWDQQGVDNLVEVGESLDIEVEVVENAGYDDITPVLNDLAEDGTDLIFCHASGYQTVCPEFAHASGVPVVVIENPGAVADNLIAPSDTHAQ